MQEKLQKLLQSRKSSIKMIYMSKHKHDQKRGINAAVWFSQQSFAGRIEPSKGGFKITRDACKICGEPPFGGEYCCGHSQTDSKESK